MIHLWSARLVSLFGPALDLVAHGVLLEVGAGHVVIVEQKQPAGKYRARQQQRHRQPVQAHAAGPERGDFVLLAQHAQVDQHRHQDGERQGFRRSTPA